jgi:hypothetical protein
MVLATAASPAAAVRVKFNGARRSAVAFGAMTRTVGDWLAAKVETANTITQLKHSRAVKRGK